MTQLSKERLEEIAEDGFLKHGEAKAIASRLLAVEAREPVAWAHRLVNKRNGVIHPWVYGGAEKSPSEGDMFRIEVMPLYTAPPAPVAVPDKWPEKLTWSHHDDMTQAEVLAWNKAIDACRAAMLKESD